jgi:hypothetical protein
MIHHEPYEFLFSSLGDGSISGSLGKLHWELVTACPVKVKG